MPTTTSSSAFIMYRPQHHPELLLAKSPSTTADTKHHRTPPPPAGGGAKKPSTRQVVQRYTYRPCPICQKRLLVRIHGSLVYKWIIDHFSVKHNEWLHVVVNLHESWT